MFALLDQEELHALFPELDKLHHKENEDGTDSCRWQDLPRLEVTGSKDFFALHTVSALCSEHGLMLGQKKVDSKSNEIKAVPRGC